MIDWRVTEPSPCFSTSRRIISLVSAHLINSHDAALFLALGRDAPAVRGDAEAAASAP